MTTSISLVSQKGGVGKTTLALNLSLSLAKLSIRTLLVDTDPQGGIALSLMGEQSAAQGLKGYLAGEPLERAVLSTRVPGFAILPTGTLRGLERATFMHQLEDGLRLSLLAETARDYDVIVYDTPAGLTGSTLGALRASDLAFTPLQAEPLAANSLPQLLEVIGDLREEGARVQFAGVILTMVQRQVDASLNVVDTIWQKLPHALVLDAHIPRDPAFLKASELGVPLGLLSKRPPPIARRFDELASELAKHIPLTDDGNDDPIPLLL